MNLQLTKQSWLLRIEAVNLGTFITDSDDLSTIRGAGLLLLGLHEFLTASQIESHDDDSSAVSTPLLKGSDYQIQTDLGAVCLKQVSTGASICVYSFQSTQDQAQQIEATVAAWLRSHPLLRHATFAVAIAPAADFQQANETALLQVRRQQLRTSSVSIGAVQEEVASSGARFCDIDGKRAAVIPLKTKSGSYSSATDKNFASPATAARRAFGRDRKPRLHSLIGRNSKSDREESTQHDERLFTPAWEFGDITSRSRSDLVSDDPSIRNHEDQWKLLDGKMAVIYVDGNKFSRQIQEAAKDVETYQAIDEHLRVCRAKLMQSFVDHMTDDGRRYWRVNRTFSSNDDATVEAFRFETLMWGGDELIWAVPAWCGLETLRYFFDHTQSWSLPVQESRQLTHAAGLVFCSHKAPIRSVVSLAKELAESGKEHIRGLTEDGLPGYNSPNANVVAYQVLESFDHLGEDFEEARLQQRPPVMSKELAILSACELNGLIEYIRELKQDISLSPTRLHQIAQFVQRTSLPESDDSDWVPCRKLLTRIAETSANREAAVAVLSKPFDQSLLRLRSDDVKSDCRVKASQAVAVWYHVSELWDYFGSVNLPMSVHRPEQTNLGVGVAQPPAAVSPNEAGEGPSDEFAAGIDKGADE